MTTTSVGLFRSGITPIDRMVQTTVGRKEMLDEILKKLKSGADKKSTQHYVFIGPRGIGKTHFLTLVENAVNSGESLKEKYTVIRFPEENNRILCFADLLLGIVHLLPEKDWSDLYDTLSVTEDDQEIIDTIIPRLKDYRKQTGKLLLIFLENLDALLTQQIKNQQDIHRFRTFLMDSPCATLIGTSPSYFPGLYDTKSPLYDFFDIQVLEDLSQEQTIEMIHRNLDWEFRQDILKNFESLIPKIRTIHAMTGGNPRLIMMLYGLVANDNILDVKVQFQKLLDQISPFYQDRLKELAPQERALLETVALMRSEPRTPAAIAKRLRMPQQQVSSLLQRMTKAGYLTVMDNPEDKRSRLYRIKEGFFDLWLAMSESRIHRQRLPYVADLLSRWYENPKERETKREQLMLKCEEPGCVEKQKENSLEMLGYLSDIGEKDEQFVAKLDLAVKNLKQGDYEKSLEYLDEVKPLAPVKGVFEWMKMETEKCREDGADDEIQKWFGDLVEYWRMQRTGDLEKAAGIAHMLGYDLSDKGLHQVRIELLRDALEHAVSADQKCRLLVGIAQSQESSGRIDDSLKTLLEAQTIYTGAKTRRNEGVIKNNIGHLYHAKGDYDTALRFLEQSLEICHEIGDRSGEGAILNNISQIYDAKGENDSALRYLEKSLKISQEIGNRAVQIPVLHNLAIIAIRKNDSKAFTQYETAAYKIALETRNVEGLYQVGQDLGRFLCSSNSLDEGLPMLRQAYAIGVKAGYPDVDKVRALIEKYEVKKDN